MFKNLLSKNLNIFTIISSGISFLGFGIIIQDTILKYNIIKIQERNELLEKQINELKIDELKNELTKTKVEQFRTSLDESQSKIINQLESIQNLNDKDTLNRDEMHSQLASLTKENEKMQNMISEIVKYIKDNNNKFIGDNNLIESLTNFINNWYNMFSTLSFEQQGAIALLKGSICILINIFTIISIL
jgi:hypothetical protein